MKNVMLTGSSGYISSNFIHLYGDKYNIIPVDKKINKNILDLTYQDYVSIDHVVHLAAISGIKQCEQDIDLTIEDNVLSAIALTQMASHTPITFASSQAAKNPQNTYAFTKKICEKYIKRYAYAYSILRFANVYGGLNYFTTKTSVVSKFINAYNDGKPLIVDGDGSQQRDFIHVNDICRAIDLSIEKPINTTVDIGTGKGTSIIDLAEMVSPFIINRYSNKVGIKSNIADTSKAKLLLNFEYKLDIEDMLSGEDSFDG